MAATYQRVLRRSTASLAAVALLGAGVVSRPQAGAADEASPILGPVYGVPGPGAPGIGDKVWPELGNGGYDVLDQHLSLTFADKLSTYTASTTLAARATQGLSRFSLDLLGPKVTAVRVDGRPAVWRTTSAGELVIIPDRPIRSRSRFVVRVDVRNQVLDAATATEFPLGLVRDRDWVQAINQPSGARRILAVSDHPAQKAPATFSVTAPSRLNTIANGRLIKTTRKAGTTTRVFREERRIATELIQIGVGPFTVLHRRGPHGIDLRFAVPTAQVAAIEPQLASFDASVRYLEARLGRYPGRIAGAYVTPLGGALETQGLTLLAVDSMTKEGFENNGTASVVLHEVAHEWFGNSVSPRRWSDLWLNEGHAIYYEKEWSAVKNGTPLAEAMRYGYEKRGNNLLVNGPIGRPDPKTFTGEAAAMRPYAEPAYIGGALVLYALRQRVGPSVFNAIERTWVREHRDGLGSTDEFIATASRVSGSDLGPFLRSWLYGTTLPKMPGHPDWRPAPRS